MTQTRRNWKQMTDEQVIEYGRENGLYGLSPQSAEEKDTRYCNAVRKRGLVDQVFERVRKAPRDWKAMTDEELIQYGKEKGYFVSILSEIRKKDRGYYRTLRSRGLVNKVFKIGESLRQPRKWKENTDDELIQYAKDNGYFGLSPSDVQRKDSGYCGAVRKRGLIDIVFKREIDLPRQWENLTDEQVVQYAKDKGYFGLKPSDLTTKGTVYYDPGFYHIARNRGLIDIVFKRERSPRKSRKWKEMTDEQLIQYGKDNGLFGLCSSEVQGKDKGYYSAINNRDLNSQVFKSEIKQHRNWEKMTDDELVQYAKEHGLFGLNSGEASSNDPGYYNAVRRRGLVDKTFERERTYWEKMTDEEVIQYARDNELFGLSPIQANDKNPRFYEALLKRRHLGRQIFRRQRLDKLEQALKELIGDAA